MLKVKKLQKIAILSLLTLLATNCSKLDNLGKKDTNQQEEPKQEEKLDQLIIEEKTLESKAKKVLDRLAKKQGPTQTFFTAMSTNLDNELKESKQSLEEAKKVVATNQAIQAELTGIVTIFKRGQGEFDINTLHPTIKDMFKIVLEIPEIKSAREEKRPIEPKRLSKEQKKWYERMLKKHYKGDIASNVGTFVTEVTYDETKKLLKVINAKVALFENIQKQYELGKKPA